MVLPAATTSLGLEHPEALVLGIAVAAALWVLWRRAAALARRLAAALGAPPGGGCSPALVLASRLAAILLLAAAAASPYAVLYREVPVTLENFEQYRSAPVRHIVVIDVSRSMGYSDIGEKRIDAAKRVLEKYLEELGKEESIAILVFSSNVSRLCSGSAADCLAPLRSLRAGGRYSALGDALARGVLEAKAPGIPGVVVLVSDGGWNYGSDPRSVARGHRDKAPVVVVKVGRDPRARILEEAARIMDAKILGVDEFTLQALNDTASELYKYAKYTALSRSGRGAVRIKYKSYDLSSMMGMAGLIALLASLREEA